MDEEADKLYNREMEKLERQQKGLRDNYNTEELNQNINDYMRVLNAEGSNVYAIRKQETFANWIIRMETFVDLAHTKNWKIHVIIGVRGHPWHTHSSPNGCFMCDDSTMIRYLYSILGQISIKYPDLSL